MLGLWPETVVALVAIWVLAELAAPTWSIRLGVGLGILATLGTAGLVGATVAAIVVAFGEHAPSPKQLRPLLGTAAAIGLAGWLALPIAFGMEQGRADVPGVAPVVASALAHHPHDFSPQDTADLERIADVELWQELYACGDMTLLLNDPEFSATAIPADRLRQIGWGAFVRHPLAAVGQRICASVALMTPSLPDEGRYYLPAYSISPNAIGVTREPVSAAALEATKAVLLRTQQPDRLVWWWRAALPVALAGAVYVLLALRKRREAIGAALLVGLGLGAFIAGPSPEFSAALPLYVVGWLSATLVVTLRRS
jgi:hypothetical protein